jgi:antibiotic biosynthesis monooxygenase (ABM) superfamily enzyme
MSQPQNVLNDPSVTVVISRRVKPECKAEFELFLLGITTACEKFDGHLGSNIFPPVNSDDPEYRIIFKFDHLSNLRNWKTSPEREYPTFSRLFRTKNNIYEKKHQETAKSDFVYL